MARDKMTNAQWESVKNLLPGKLGDRGRTGNNNRLSLEGILWIMRTGAPWRDLPSRYGKWITVYQRFRRWQRAGVFFKIFESVQNFQNLSVVMVDGTIVKAHQHSAGAPKTDAHQVSRLQETPSAGAVVGAQRK